MKKTIYSILCIALGLSLIACSDNMGFDNSGAAGSANGDLTFNIQEEGISAKSSTNGYKTTFKEGDAASLFIVKADGSVEENLQIIMNEDGLWQVTNGLPRTSDLNGAKFYVCYPYNADMEFDATSDKPFEVYIKGTEQATDISENDKYIEADIMISSVPGTLGETNSIDINLGHAMEMFCVELPSEGYKFFNTDVMPYLLKQSTNATFKMNGKEAKPFFYEPLQQYRFLINPYTSGKIETSFTNPDGVDKTADINYTEGIGNKYYPKKIDGGFVATDWTLVLGDYYMKDGTLAKGTETSFDQNNVLGVVAVIAVNKELQEVNANWQHAMVLSLNQSSSAKKWSDNSPADAKYVNWNTTYGINDVGSGPWKITDGVSHDPSGYGQTAAWMKAYNNGEEITVTTTAGTEQVKFANIMGEELTTQRTNYVTPDNLCSGWYIPDYWCWKQVCSNATSINTAINKLTREDKTEYKPATVYWGSEYGTTKSKGYEYSFSNRANSYQRTATTGSGTYRYILGF